MGNNDKQNLDDYNRDDYRRKDEFPSDLSRSHEQDTGEIQDKQHSNK
ncbi:hypothetical protein SM124_22895 [Bacillus sp. 31A1R]|uniref:Uncharacterized protein n=1 Tax=Robertmurraya mangrovi TaxID=3098077 RepID=A0ABU5J543_9BACI|nr:hypothetical protein [Bacillus sp. 31A1R]MDZ5474528.1 hypothetical protein [Bacillus sp. 31A1R]